VLCFSLEMLEKVEPPIVPDGYGLSVGFYCLVEAVRTIQLIVEGEAAGDNKKADDKPCDENNSAEEKSADAGL